MPGAGAAPPALPAAPQLSLGWSWSRGAGERSHKWFLSAAEEFRPGSGAAGGGAGCRGGRRRGRAAGGRQVRGRRERRAMVPAAGTEGGCARPLVSFSLR